MLCDLLLHKNALSFTENNKDFGSIMKLSKHMPLLLMKMANILKLFHVSPFSINRWL